MSTPQEAYDQLMTELREISLMGSIGGVLGWDEKTHMPLMLTWVGTVQQQFNRGGGNRGGGGGGNRGGGGPPNFPQSQAPNQGRRGGNAGILGNAAPQQANMQMHVSNYKTVSGIKVPHLIQSGANNETTEEFVVKNVRINPSFRADLFTK